MATPIIVNPTKPSQVVVNGTQKSGTPITINTDLDYTRVQSMIGEALGDVKIDTTELAKESTLITESQRIQDEVRNIDFSTVKNKVDEVKQAVENIDLSPIENKVQEESTAIQSKIDNIQLPGIDTTELAKQGEDPYATNTAIFNAVKSIPDISLLYAARAEKNDDGVNTYSIVLPVMAKVTYDNNGVATIQL